MTVSAPERVSVLGGATEFTERVLTPDALRFIAGLQREFGGRRRELLQRRRERHAALQGGAKLDFLPETAAVRSGTWRVAAAPADLDDRRVEITGPVDRKMMINALNSGAKVFMADLEDALSPTWPNVVDGQGNLMDAVRRTLSLTTPEKRYELAEHTATLLVRPRGWHLEEQHVLVDDEPMSGSLFDFGLYFFHNARYRATHDGGIYFYLPKLEHYLEARLWNEVFVWAQEAQEIPQGTIKATVLIEHILATFQMEEILYELRHHSAGLNCGRWDYIFSYIKKFARKEDHLVPDRAQVTMTTPFMRAYALSCIKACHKRGTFAMGGMAAFIPIKGDAAANEKALQKVREDKRREATDGHDGTWVAHPGLVQVAREEFDKVLGTKPNQIERQREDIRVTEAQLLEVPQGTITEEGLRTNIRVGIQYLESWLGGLGCVPLYNLMEDAATAEISRTQVWQWVHNPRGILEDGRKVTLELVRKFIDQELGRIRFERGGERFEEGHFEEATELFHTLIADEHLAEFLTLKAYDRLLELEPPASETIEDEPIRMKAREELTKKVA